MAIIQIETLLQPLAGDSPCGEDCEYDPAFGELERAAQGVPESRMGDSVIDAEPPNWRVVAEQSTALFDRTKDLRIAVLLARAAVVIDGLQGLSDGIELIHRLLVDYWDTLYPLLDEDDDNDPTFRMNSLLALSDRKGFVADINRMPLVNERQLGQFSYRDIRMANGDVDPAGEEVRPDSSHIDAAFFGAELEPLQVNAQWAALARESLAAIDTFLKDKVGASVPEFAPLEESLKGIDQTFRTQLERRGIGDGVATDDGAADTGAVTAETTVLVAAPGEIRSRDDVIRNLDRICEYFRQHEPSSPVPILLERAKRLVSKDFVEILKDLTPSGVAEALTIAGITEEEQGW